MTRLDEALSSTYFGAVEKIQGLKKRLVKVFVEGYDDVSFWRTILDEFESDSIKFEISVPIRGDLAKGKKVVISLLPQSGPNLILCVDSDFDYLFGDFDEQSRLVNNSKYLFHTYAYSIENYLCYPPSLHSLCVKATKNDVDIFDFVEFMREYSKIIYPLFLWYALSAQKSVKKAFTLIDFKNSVRLNYIDLHDNGRNTLAWLSRQATRRLHTLESKNPDWIADMPDFEQSLAKRGLSPENTNMFMQGHTLKNNVVQVLLVAVCEKMREISSRRITDSERRGLSLKNEQSNYTNSLRNIKEVLADNERYKSSSLYKKLVDDIRKFCEREL